MNKQPFSNNIKRCGLINEGNTCFLNTAIQCISNIGELTEYIYSNDFLGDLNRERKESSITYEYSKLLKKLMNNDEQQTRAINFINIFCRVNNNLEISQKLMRRQQSDVYEFLMYLIDIIHVSLQEEVDIEIKGKPKNDYEHLKIESIKSWIVSIKNEYSKMIDILFGQYISETFDSDNGKLLSRNFSKFNSLSLEIFDKEEGFVASTLYDCFDYHCKVTELTGENKYQVGDTDNYVDAKRKLYFWKLPKYLVICLKRFNFSNQGRKINSRIEFPIDDLDLSKYVFPGSKEKNKYKLISIANHLGNSLNGGHYYCVNRIGNNDWVLYNDESVHDINYGDLDELKSKIVTKNVFLLIYTKI